MRTLSIGTQRRSRNGAVAVLAALLSWGAIGLRVTPIQTRGLCERVVTVALSSSVGNRGPEHGITPSGR
jgi:3-deoxy-D-arabino-heptulosonate 7-phosphate (DAHP) synthase